MDGMMPISTSLGLKSKAGEDFSFLGPKEKVWEGLWDEETEELEEEAESSSRKSSLWWPSSDAMVR